MDFGISEGSKKSGFKYELAAAIMVIGMASIGTNVYAKIIWHSRDYFQDDERNPIEARRKLAKGRSTEDILALGFRNDKVSIPMLRQFVATPVPTEADYLQAYKTRGYPRWILRQKYRDASRAAKMALSRMGEKSYFDEFVVGLSTTDAEWRTVCIQALGYIGDKRALKYLGPILAETGEASEQRSETDDHGKPRVEKYYYGPYSGIAESAFLDILLPEFMDKYHDRRAVPIGRWKEWWKENQDKYK